VPGGGPGWNNTAIATAAATVRTGPPRSPTSVPMPTTMPAYVAVTVAESSPYTRARLMMTSIAYSPCLRIATVMAAGNPTITRRAITAYEPVTSHEEAPWLAAVASRAASWEASAVTPASANHLICWRDSRPPAR
jgi:hypothetical protein